MAEETYNGWTNYETWAVALWLDNEAGSQAYWREATREAWQEAASSKQVREWSFNRSDAARILLADRLKSEVEEGNPIEEASLYADLIGAALSSVNWHEIARHYVEESECEDDDENGIAGR